MSDSTYNYLNSQPTVVGGIDKQQLSDKTKTCT